MKKGVIAIAVLAAIGGTAWWVFGKSSSPTAAGGTGAAAAGARGAPVNVTTTKVATQSLPLVALANGTVVSLQAVDVRAQITSTVKAIHFREGQMVARGDLLFTLDNRTEEANLQRALAQVLKSRNDFANAERNLARQRDLFNQKFISQASLDTAINQTDLARGQLAVDEASAEAARVARTLTEIRAPFTGRTGAINVRAGSLVTPTNLVMVTVSQIEPIAVSFSLPERELAAVRARLARGEVPVSVEVPSTKATYAGQLSFIESTVDTASGTIPMKATFTNKDGALWPGMFVNVSTPTRQLENASVVPVQAVQTGPDRKFVYVVGADNTAQMQPVEVVAIQSGLAAVTGVAPEARVVVEGAQNVRPKGPVVEAATKTPGKAGKAKGGAEDKAAAGDKPADKSAGK